MLGDVKKELIEAQEKVKRYESQKVCRKYEAGRCNDPHCRYAHVLPVSQKKELVKQLDNLVKKTGSATEGMGTVSGSHLAPESPLKDGHCLHYERGYCKYFNKCKKVHDENRYGVRPRSGSHGSQQGFQTRPKTKGNLGTIAEVSPQLLPEFVNPAMLKSDVQEQIQRMDNAAKGPNYVSEEMIQEQLNLLRNRSNQEPEERGGQRFGKAFASKRD